jgi:hypothetical protein
MTAAWRSLTTTRYTRHLEAVVDAQRDRIERLELDNRALMNSMLERAGFSGIPLHGSEPRPQLNFRPRGHSWPQIAAMRERQIASDMARKAKEREDAG